MIRSTNVQPLDDRRSTRSDVSLPATLEAGPGQSIAITVVNISAHGVMARTSTPLLPGRPVALAMAGLDRHPARIAWVRGEHLGIAFDRPLTLTEILAVL